MPVTAYCQNGKGGSGKGGGSALSQSELTKRLQAQERAQALVAEGDTLAARGNHCDAADRYSDAAAALRPGASATAALRAEAVRKFAKSGVACAKEQAANGAYEQARTRLSAILADDMAPNDKPAQTLLKQLDDPDRHNPALTPQHAANVQKVAKLLRRAEQFVELGDFTTAEAAYNQALAVDPTNTAARRGLERVQNHITEYHKSARDETRLRMLNAVDRVWEPKVPSFARFGPGDSSIPGDAMPDTSVTGKLRTIIFPRLSLSDASIADAVNHLAKKSAELDPEGRGINIVWNGNGGGAPREVNVDLKNVTLEEGLRAICDSAGVRYRAEASVVIVSMTAAGGMETRQFRVPPGFLSTAASATPTETVADPFATPDPGASKPRIGRLDPKTYLENQDIEFPPGARAGYNPSANMLIVTNTAENLERVAFLVDGLISTTQRQVLVQVLLLKASQTNLREAGTDIFMEAFSMGGSDLIFGMGGTYGNQGSGAQSIQAPFNVVQGPMTAGLRSSYELTRQRNIDDLIAISDSPASALNTATRSPHIAGIGGMFTNPRFQALIRQLDQKKGIDLSVANKVIVKSGQRATAFSGRDFSYPTEFDPPQIPQTVQAPQFDVFDPTTGQGFTLTGTLGQSPVTPATPSSFETKQIGSSIEVEATVGEDGHTVDLNLAVSFNEFDGFINYGTPITSNDDGAIPTILTDNRIIQPVFSKAAATAQVLIYDGQTVALGGLLSNKTETIEDKVPIFSSIPIFGKLFKSKLTRDSRMTVIYFVTVQVIDPSGEGIHSDSPVASDTPSLPSDPGFDPNLLKEDPNLRAGSGK